ncbi:hypothetical protein ACEPAH_3982 [Sanghuangporus vaninii]
MDAPLHVAIQDSLRARAVNGTPVANLAECTPASAPDLFSNDYLSISSDTHLQQSFLASISKCTSGILGAGGSRLLGGNRPMHVQFEERMKEIFSAPEVLLCNSGYDANVALLSCLPQKGDAIVFDELIHASTRDGAKASRASGDQYAFKHNSITSLRSTLEHVLGRHKNISQGKGTVFIAVESLYSMDGDLAPLTSIVDLAEKLIPKDCFHIIVDEAHSTGIYGASGEGIVSMLGLSSRVHTVVHTFGKARGFSGAILLTSALVKKYIVNYGRPFIYSTALPCIHILALDAIFNYIVSPLGRTKMDRLQYLCHYFETRLIQALDRVPKDLLCFVPKEPPIEYPTNIHSPIFPLLTPVSLQLSRHLRSLGYASQAIPFPVVPRGQERIRVIVHAGNTEPELEDFIQHLVNWASTRIHYEVSDQLEVPQLAKL